MFPLSSKWWRHWIWLILSVDYGQVYIFVVYNLMMSSDLIYLIRSTCTLIWFTFKLYFTSFISYQISAWGIVSFNNHGQSSCIKHVFDWKVTFSTNKELLTQAYIRKLCADTQKSVCKQDNVNQSRQSCVYTTISKDFLCQHNVSYSIYYLTVDTRLIWANVPLFFV